MAKHLGVGTTTVKRWADAGVLQFELTPGGHRRFRIASAPRFATPDDLDALGDHMREVGERWERGEIGVHDEHRETHRVAEELDRARPGVEENAPLALLACPPGELHELPLRMVRLVLEWRGWRTEMLGAATPWDALQAAVKTSKPQLVALSAREPITIPCRLGAKVIVGGSWARGPAPDNAPPRFRSLRAFDRWLGAM